MHSQATSGPTGPSRGVADSESEARLPRAGRDQFSKGVAVSDYNKVTIQATCACGHKSGRHDPWPECEDCECVSFITKEDRDAA